jgi:putative flippase GtrA
MHPLSELRALMKRLSNFLRGKTGAQLARYFIGGCSTAALSWSFLLVLVEWYKVNYFISANLSGILAYFCSYIINKYLVFKNHGNVPI